MKPILGSSVARESEAIAFCYRKGTDGSLRQWSDGRIEIEKYIQPWKRGSCWTYADVDLVYDEAAREIRAKHAKGELRFGLTRSFALTVFRNTAIDYTRRRGPGRDRETSLESPPPRAPRADQAEKERLWPLISVACGGADGLA